MRTSRRTPKNPALALLFAGLALGSFCEPRAAHAEGDSDEAASKVLFNDARKLVADGNFEKACPKFEEALRLHVGIGIQYNLADCWEHLGRTASARALFLGVAASARAAGQSEREQMSRDRALALEPRLSHLTIEVQAKDSELKVRKNQSQIASADYGANAVVDPGKYRIEASAPGKKPWSQEVELRPAESKTVSVPELEPLALACEKTPGASKAKAKAENSEGVPEKPARSVERDPQEPHASSRWTYTLPLAAVGVGAVAAGTIFGFKYRANNDAASKTCPSSVDCTQAEIDHHQHLVDDAKMFRSWSFVGFGVGGAALIGAGIAYFGSAPPARGNARSWTIAPSVGGAWGVNAIRSF